MTLHIPTIVVLLLLCAVLMALVLWLGPKTDHKDGLGKWICGLCVVAIAWSFFASRETAPNFVAVVLANTTMMAGLCLQVAALLEFGQRRPPLWLALPPLIVFAILSPVRDNFVAYTLIASFSQALPLFALGFYAWRFGDGAARWPMAFFYAAGGFTLSLRAVVSSFLPEAELSLFQSNRLSSTTFIIMFAMTITGSFGYLEMRRQRSETALRHLASFDALTNLFNRRSFMDLSERALSRARRNNESIALLMLDIDHFKKVNDNYGHVVGDQVLAAVANSAQHSLRKEDLLGRYGGEEFCALLPNTNLEQASAIAERIRAGVEALSIPGVAQAITVSIGITLMDCHEKASLSAGIERADVAMYRAKEEGRNRVRIELQNQS